MRLKRKTKRARRCPCCKARSPKAKYYIFPGRGYASENFGGGLRLCKDAFHGTGGWTR